MTNKDNQEQETQDSHEAKATEAGSGDEQNAQTEERTAGSPQEAGDSRAQSAEPKRFVDDQRNRIVAKSRKRRQQATQEFREADGNAAGAGKIREFAGQADVAEGEVTPESADQREEKAEPDAQAGAGEGQAESPETLDLKGQGDTVRLKVDGKEIEVPKADVLNKGREALQKTLAINQRFEDLKKFQDELNTARSSLEDWEKRLKAKEEQLASGAKSQPEAGQEGANSAEPPAKGASAEKLGEVLDNAVKALLRGNSKDFKQGLMEALAANANGRTEGATQVKVEDIVDSALAKLDERKAQDAMEARKKAAGEVNDFFAIEYSDIDGDEELASVAQVRMARKMAELPPESWMDAAKEVGDSVRRDFLNREAEQSQSSSLGARTSRKANLPPSPAATSGRVPGPSRPKPRTAKDVIREIRQSRNQQA